MDIMVKQVTQMKSNKENTKPDTGTKKAESRDVISKVKRPAPLRLKNEARDEKEGEKSKGQVKPSKCAAGKDVAQRKTLSQAFRTEQTLRHRKLVLEPKKTPASVPPKPLLPGTYKGRVVKSKIDCFRKPISLQDKNPSENKTKAKSEVCSKSTALSASSKTRAQNSKAWAGAQLTVQNVGPQKRIQSSAHARTSTVSAKPSSVSAKPPSVSAKPPSVSAKPPSVSSKLSVISRKPVMMSAKPPTVTSFIRNKELLKPAAAAGEKKPHKSAHSSISQYRIRVETAEERRLKLADWLASKGKTLKRPALTEKSAFQIRHPHLHAENEAQPELSKQTETALVGKTEQNEVPQRKPAFSSSPSHILNTTLDLLDNSDTEPAAEPEIRMESLVMNLCEKLEAMETPSSCRSQIESGGNTEVKLEETTSEYEIVKEEELSEGLKSIAEVEKTEEEEDDKNEIKMKVKEKKESKLFEVEDEEEKMDSTPADVLDACVVKYSVKTTPFLQGVKQRMESEMAPGTPGSRCKSSIKELKFLTPVRRSSRIHRNSSRLPGMLNEHDPCVSSLAELELLDAADLNAYIYRKNPALLQHLPDHHPEAQSLEHSCK